MTPQRPSPRAQDLFQPRHHQPLLEKERRLPWQTQIHSGSVKITEITCALQKHNFSTRGPE